MREVILCKTRFYSHGDEISFEKIVANTELWEAVSEEDWPILETYCSRNGLRIVDRCDNQDDGIMSEILCMCAYAVLFCLIWKYCVHPIFFETEQ